MSAYRRPVRRSTRPRLRRAVLQAFAALRPCGWMQMTEVAAFVGRRDHRQPYFTAVYDEIRALEASGLVRSRANTRDPNPLRRPCRPFRITPAGLRALAGAGASSRHVSGGHS